MIQKADPLLNASEDFERPGLSYDQGRYSGFDPFMSGNKEATLKSADWNWLTLHFSPLQSSIQAGGALNVTGQTFQNIRVFGLALPDVPQGEILFTNAINQVVGSPSLFWDNTNSILKLGSENMLQIASVGQPFRIRTDHSTNLGVQNPTLVTGYNAAGVLSVAVNKITAGTAAHSIELEGNYSPDGVNTQVEWNHNYWSPDGTTYRRGFTYVCKNAAPYLQTWTWRADAYEWDNNTAGAALMLLSNAGKLTLGGTGTATFNASYGAASVANPVALFGNNSIQVWLDNGGLTTNCGFVWYDSAHILNFGRLGNTAWQIGANGDWLAAGPTNTQSIGSGAGLIKNINFGTQILGPDGALGAGNVSYSFTNATSTGMYKSTANGLSLTTNGVEALRVDSSQNVTLNALLAFGAFGGADTFLSRAGVGILLLGKGNATNIFRVAGNIGASIYAILTHNGTDANIDSSSGKLIIGGTASDIQYGKALVALGGGAAPTFGTIGGSGPTAAAQNAWKQEKDSTGATYWIPIWK